MPSEIHDARTHTFYSQDEVLFDANVWFYLEGPPGQHEELVEIYSGLLDRLQARGAALVTAPLVLSEFVNRYARIEYNAWSQRSSKAFKEYRSSEAFAPVKQDIHQACRNIIGLSTRTVRRAISLEELEADLATFAAGTHDFNDLMIARLCRQEQLMLVTHDADFADLDGLVIVTANRTMLGR